MHKTMRLLSKSNRKKNYFANQQQKEDEKNINNQIQENANEQIQLNINEEETINIKETTEYLKQQIQMKWE